MARPSQRSCVTELSRRGALAGISAVCASAGAFAQDQIPERLQSPFTYAGRLTQGGVLIGRTQPHASIAVDGKAMGSASGSGLFVVGFDRDAPASADVAVFTEGLWRSQVLSISPVSYDIQRIDGLPPQMVTPTDPAILEREQRDRAQKEVAFASRIDRDDFKDGFILPLDHPVKTSPFGVQRVLNGEPKAPHYGVDLAAPIGASIFAPAAGLVVLAAPDLYLDGGLTLIDHGQGLISMYLHQSQIEVKTGDRVEQRQLIGGVGMKGRATGPHLCWRMKWRDRNLDPSLMIGSRAPLG